MQTIAFGHARAQGVGAGRGAWFSSRMLNPKAFLVAVLALLVLAATASGAPASARPGLTLLGCVTGNNRVAAAQGCSKVSGSGGRADDAGLKGVTALAGGGAGPALYAIGSENSAITQLVRGGSSTRPVRRR